MQLDRRKFLKTLATAGAAAALPPFPARFPVRFPAGFPVELPAVDQPQPGSFDFVFFTDTHIQPELDAAHGCDMCFRKIATTKSDFAIMGGDHVFGVNATRARMVFDMYGRAEQLIGMPLHNAIGNHDVFGVLTKSGVAPTDPAYGKKMYQ